MASEPTLAAALAMVSAAGSTFSADHARELLLEPAHAELPK